MAWLDIGTVASVATAVSVTILLYQIVLNGRRATARFEDELVSEYRDVVNELPLEALLGEELSDDRHYENLSDFYRYVDLSNEQIFLRQENQISKETWVNWRIGINSNLARPAFRRAWSEIKYRSDGDFSELRNFENPEYGCDPYLWNDEGSRQARHDLRQFTSSFSLKCWKIVAQVRSRLSKK